MTTVPEPLVVQVPGWLKLTTRLFAGTDFLSRNPILVVDGAGIHLPTTTKGQMALLPWAELREVVVQKFFGSKFVFFVVEDPDAVIARTPAWDWAQAPWAKSLMRLQKRAPSPFATPVRNIPLATVLARIRAFSDVPIRGADVVPGTDSIRTAGRSTRGAPPAGTAGEGERAAMPILPSMRDYVPGTHLGTRPDLPLPAAPSRSAPTYPTPFQLGGLVRSALLGGIAVTSFGSLTAGGVLVGLTLAGLVLYRLVGSSFYLRAPLGGWPKVAMVVHDVVGTLTLWVCLAVVLIITFILSFFGIPFFWWLTSLLGFGGSKTALNKDGVVYHRNLFTGQWEPQSGLFGPKTDQGLFGPNIVHGWFGAKAAPGAGVDGEPLYERRS